MVRNIGFFEMQQKQGSIDSELKERITIRDEGYAFFGGSGPSLHIDEIVPDDEDRIDGLIGEIERQAQDAVYDRMVLNAKLLATYRLRGYITHNKSHGLLMAKSLTKEASFKETYSDRFYMTVLDSF